MELVTEILDLDYNSYVSLLGTAHFTRRSLLDAHEAVRRLKPTDLAIELDVKRFQFLNQRCAGCPYQQSCSGRCEFVGATDALGNVDASIWLIDMSEREIGERVRRLLPPSRLWWYSFVGFPFLRRRGDDELELWERGYKSEVLERHARRLETLRVTAPHVWRVLIDERNALMAARLAWIVTQRLSKGEEARILALTGAAHVQGIGDLLGSAESISGELGRLGLRFSPPRLVRRVGVN
jgi:radical SAM protein with 4Fe4S-binding SPASM domain